MGSSFKQCASIVAAYGLGLYVSDCYHVYHVLKERRDLEESEEDEECETLMAEVIKNYADDSSNISKEQFRKGLAADCLERDAESSEVLGPFKLSRESIAFAAGGRAVLLQLAHPYVASGITAHSDLRNGIQGRFYRTFKYMFGMIFGTDKDAIRSAKTVRSLHSKVHGVVGEDVGIFKKDSTYDAVHAHAMLWVHFTLIDSMFLAYEMLVENIPEIEKTNYILESNKLASQMFGIPGSLLPQSFNKFQKINNAITKTQVIDVGEQARSINEFVWTAPSNLYAPVFSLVKWLTTLMVPRKIAVGFYGRAPTSVEYFLGSLYFGQIRFVYRLLPGSFRYLSAYMKMRHRKGPPLSTTESYLSSLSADMASSMIATLLPQEKPLELH